MFGKLINSVRDRQPHPPSPSPKERERCFITIPCFITTTSASPPFLLSKREEAVLQIFNELLNYHIIFITLINTFENSDTCWSLRKAWAVRCSSPSERLGEAVRDEALYSLNRFLNHSFYQHRYHCSFILFTSPQVGGWAAIFRSKFCSFCNIFIRQWII